MYINDKKLSQLLKRKGKAKNQLRVFLMDFSKTVSISLTLFWDKVEYLSLRNNYLKDMSFLECFPMLFYLDLTGNPIEDFEVLNKHNSFGYLGLTAPQNFLEKNILAIKGLNIGILEFEIRNQLFKEQFIKNNSNVLYFNGRYYSFNEKAALMKKADYKPSIFGGLIGDFLPLNKSSKAGAIARTITYNPSITNEKINEKFTVINNNPWHSSVKELVTFIENYNKAMIDCLSEAPELFTVNNHSTAELPSDLIRSKVIKTMQKEERKRLLILSSIFMQITNYNNIPERTFAYHKDLNVIHKEKGINYLRINLSLFQLKDIPMQLLVLSIIYLYIIGIFSKDISIEVLYSFHVKYNTQKDESYATLRDDIQSFFNLNCFFIISFYFDISNTFSSLFKGLKLSNAEDEKNKIDYGVVKYNDLRKSLRMKKLVMNISQLEQHHHSTCSLIKMHEASSRNEMIQSLILHYLEQEGIYKETLQIVQFVNDFLLLNKYESILVKELSNDYRLFHEIKEQLYKNINSAHDSLSERKYNETKMKTLRNKYFFQTVQYNQFTSLGSQLNRFYIAPKPTFYPIKQASNNRNICLDEKEEEMIKGTLKLSQDLQKVLSIRSEKKKATSTKRIAIPQTQLFRKNFLPKQLVSKEANEQKGPRRDSILQKGTNTSILKTSRMELQLIHEKSPMDNIFNYKELKKRKSQSVTCLFSKAKKLPKLHLKSKPLYIENSPEHFHRFSVDQMNKITFRLNANQRTDRISHSNTIESFVVLEPKYK